MTHRVFLFPAALLVCVSTARPAVASGSDAASGAVSVIQSALPGDPATLHEQALRAAGNATLTREVPPDAAQAQAGAAAPAKRRRGEWYFTFGYNSNRYAPTSIHFSQPALGNDFTFHKLTAHDDEGWTKQVLNHDITVPQFNARLGYFFNERQDLAIEIAYDHPKYIVDENQQARLTGIVNGVGHDEMVTITPDVLRYWLNNGANFIDFNLVKRRPLKGRTGDFLSLALLTKGGGGFQYPHADNTVFGAHNGAYGKKGFQVGGWNVAAEATLRFGLPLSFYLEASEKVVYARYLGITIDQGKASHVLRDNEIILTIGRSFNRHR